MSCDLHIADWKVMTRQTKHKHFVAAFCITMCEHVGMYKSQWGGLQVHVSHRESVSATASRVHYS